MDINPKRFEAPWTAYEFATHCVDADTPLVVLSMAWLTRLLPQELVATADQPDLETLSYWLQRFMPIVESKREDGIVLVLANRCGTEPGMVAGVSQGVNEEGQDVVGYAGTSCVLLIQESEIRIFDIMGKAEEKLLKVDTAEVSSNASKVVSWLTDLASSICLALEGVGVDGADKMGLRIIAKDESHMCRQGESRISSDAQE